MMAPDHLLSTRRRIRKLDGFKPSSFPQPSSRRDFFVRRLRANVATAKRSLQGVAPSRYLALADPIVQWPRTPPFHGGNTGSNPVRVASNVEANPEIAAVLVPRALHFDRKFRP
jgi:hypothetical protein